MRLRTFTAAALLALPAGCGEPAPAERTESRAATPNLIAPDTVTVELPYAVTAQLYVERDAVVYARAKGIVQAVGADIGSSVPDGALLASLESEDQEIALARAEAAMEEAERTVGRQREMASLRLISPADSEQAELAHRRAALEVQQAKRNLELTRVRAPFAGVVTGRWVRPRRLVNEGDTLFRVTTLAPLLAAVHVPEPAAASVKVGDAVEVEAADGRRAKATVIRASPVVDPASSTREHVVQLVRSAGLRPGATVTVRLGRERRRVLALPAEAVSEDGFVLVWENGRTTLRGVTLGARLPDGRREVVEGLALNERVVPATR